MTYSRFLDLLEEQIMKGCRFEEEVRRVRVLKNNDVKLDGFSCRMPNHREQPTVYVNHYYREDLLPEDIKDIAGLVLDIFRESILHEETGLELLLDYKKIKPYIFLRLISKEKNRELLKDIPYLTWLDLAVVFYIRVPEHIIKNATALIHKNHMMRWEIDLKTLYDIALENTVKEPVLLHPMEQFLEEYGFTDVNSGMYILSNERKEFGAAVIIDSRIQRMCAERFREDYYVLPSSIHEVLLLPASRAGGKRELDVLVQEVNRTCVHAEDYLSNHVYYYSIEDNQLKL